jgi:hypothetical protein
METKRILRPLLLVAGACANKVDGSSNADVTAAPAATAPAPMRTKSRRVIDGFILVLFACSAILALGPVPCKVIRKQSKIVPSRALQLSGFAARGLHNRPQIPVPGWR